MFYTGLDIGLNDLSVQYLCLIDFSLFYSPERSWKKMQINQQTLISTK